MLSIVGQWMGGSGPLDSKGKIRYNSHKSVVFPPHFLVGKNCAKMGVRAPNLMAGHSKDRFSHIFNLLYRLHTSYKSTVPSVTYHPKTSQHIDHTTEEQGIINQCIICVSIGHTHISRCFFTLYSDKLAHLLFLRTADEMLA